MPTVPLRLSLIHILVLHPSRGRDKDLCALSQTANLLFNRLAAVEGRNPDLGQKLCQMGQLLRDL